MQIPETNIHARTYELEQVKHAGVSLLLTCAGDSFFPGQRNTARFTTTTRLMQNLFTLTWLERTDL